MPEIKHTFIGGKMNKDLDERLIPKDGYVDAMNIQVSTSEESDVGTAQNLLGNKEIPSGVNMTDAVTVASIADEKSDKLYYYVYTPRVDYIFEYSRLAAQSELVFVDVNKDTLKFHPDHIITGINIIDGMLFWTDNRTEPKKINIERSKQGTVSAAQQTKLVNDSQSISAQPLSQAQDVKEEHITVIKKAPRKPLDMRVITSRDPKKIYTGVITITREANKADSSLNNIWDFSSISTDVKDVNATPTTQGDTFITEIEEAVNQFGLVSTIGPVNNTTTGLTGWQNGTSGLGNIPVGTKVLISPFEENGDIPSLPLTDYVLKGVIVDAYPNSGATTYSNGVKIQILSINDFPPVIPSGQTQLKLVVDLFDETEKLFEFKFPRFSYRYKYEDGEYSTFAPFTEVAFSPGSFDYHPRKGYNLGMTNKATAIELSRIVTKQTPKDVVSIDILFKDEPSPNIYIVDTIRPNDFASSGSKNYWDSIKGEWESGVASIPYVISKETVNSVVPSNQLLRPYDNVPRLALAQDVTGNRIVYANYLQNYDLKTIGNKNYTPSFSVSWTRFYDSQFYDDGFETVELETIVTDTLKSIKSLREYQLGVVFTDKYGRETPVLSNNQAVLKLEKERADKANKIKIALKNGISKPIDLTHMKFYVKETAGEYYNMAMDRFYDAEDSNVWLAFPSSDRNKVDIDTFLILKKGSDQDTLVSEAARYKILAIENEAPDFIKTNRILSCSVKHNSTGKDLFTDSGADIPIIGRDSFKMSYSPFVSGSGRNLDTVTDAQLYIEFEKFGQKTKRYRISSIATDFGDGTGITLTASKYSVQLEDVLGEDVNFITNDPTGISSSSILDDVVVNIYKYRVENTPKFDGRFFVKIYLNDTFTNNIGKSFRQDLDFRILSSKKLYSMRNYNDHIDLHWKHDALSSGEKYLFDGYYAGVGGIKSSDFSGIGDENLTDSQVRAWLGTPGQDNLAREALGYYAVDEFASMAAYFRRYEVGTYNSANGLMPSIKHLKPAATGGIEYKGQNWIGQDDWEKEIGQGSPKGYTANWGSVEISDIKRFEERVYTDADNPIDTDVWFIDGGPAAGFINSSQDLRWDFVAPNSLASQGSSSTSTGTTGPPLQVGYEHAETDPGGHANQLGLATNTNGSWYMQLSYGGIKGDQNYAGQSGGLKTEDFFNFGDWNTLSNDAQNSYYTTNNNNNVFVRNIAAGSRFRFREDPAQTVYTLSDITMKNLLRHSARTGPGYVDIGGGNRLAATGGVAMAEKLSFNFTAGWNLKSITPALAWNPYQLGQIQNGIDVNLTIVTVGGGTTSGNTATSSVGDITIYVNSLSGTDVNTGLTVVLQEGMALSQYTKTGSASAATLQTNLTNSANEFLVITDIIEGAASSIWLTR
mgnify:CR=1 FL=1